MSVQTKSMTQPYFIDKTEYVEKEIAQFPSLYIEGAAACGKSVAVQMLLEQNTNVNGIVFQMADEAKNLQQWLTKIRQIKASWHQDAGEKSIWVILEDISAIRDMEVLETIADFILHMPEHYKVILTGRERPADVFLRLMWKRKMELLPQRGLVFSKDEVRMLAEQRGSALHPDEVYAASGGWPGCVDMILRLSANKVYGNRIQSVNDFLQCYEMETYIRQEILDTLSPQEKEVMNVAAICPWVAPNLFREVFGMEEMRESLLSLERKGLLLKNDKNNHWQMASLFRTYYENLYHREKAQNKSWKYLGEWYECHGYIKEAIECFRRSDDENLLRNCMLNHYQQVPFLGIGWDEVLRWKEALPRLMYLRGMYFHAQKNVKGLQKEIHRVEKLIDSDGETKEILLNLLFVMPEISLEEWLRCLENPINQKQKFHLYGILGNSYTMLCGLRDLTELFSGTKSERKRKERLWKEKLDEDAGIAYELAKIEYILETGQGNQLEERDFALLSEVTTPLKMEYSKMKEDFCLAGMHLLCRLQSVKKDSEMDLQIQNAMQYLQQEGGPMIVKNAEAIYAIYSLQYSKRENLERWMRYRNEEYPVQLNEENYTLMFYQVRSYILFHQYDKAEKILAPLILYLQEYRRTLFLTESLFLRAVAYRGMGQQNLALRSAIESFVVGGKSRYVRMYTQYGKKGKEILEQYIEWMKNNAPGGWHRKKKYNYGSVLRMPIEDYLETVLRLAKREVKNYSGLEELEQEEHLTMMETIILQNLNRGLSNAEICQELNLKLPTVKTHIYSLYKKMGVNSRTQAIIKGKEQGLIK